MRKAFAVLMIAMMCLCFMPSAAFGATSEEETIISADCSKTATELTSDYKSDVTLSFPSEETELVTDIVFVLDKSTSAELEQKALDMLKDLKSRVDYTGAKVKVGVVIFNKEAHPYGFYDLSTEPSEIEKAIGTKVESGTNLHAGLLAGKKMLDEDKSVPAGRKYLIVVSDGITYMYNTEPTAIALSNGDSDKSESAFAGPDNWGVKYENNSLIPGDWTEWLKDIGSKVASDGNKYDMPYDQIKIGETKEKYLTKATSQEHAMSIDKALYLSNQVYQEAKEEGYHCFAMCADTSSYDQFAWGPSFIRYLAGDKTVSFGDIERHVVYAVSENSVVNDFIGKGIDNLNCQYNFDFVQDYDMVVKVGEKVYTCNEPEKNEETGTMTYVFTRENDNADFKLVYYPGENEHFEWYINHPITNFERVQLTFQVKLTNPSGVEGTHNVYTNDGHAVLIPTDSTGMQGNSVKFPIPQVSYTVKKAEPPVPIYPTYTSVSVHKEWKLDDGGAAADSVTVQLYRNGVKYPGGEVTLSKDNNWSHTWRPVYAYGDVWTVEEVNVPEGFTATVTKAAYLNDFTVINDDVKPDPTEPTEPEKPTKPEKPDKPDKPAKPCKPETEVPKTGDTAPDAMLINTLALTLSALGGMLIWYRKKQEDK